MKTHNLPGTLRNYAELNRPHEGSLIFDNNLNSFLLVASDRISELEKLIPIAEDLLTWCIEEDKKFIYKEKIESIKKGI